MSGSIRLFVTSELHPGAAVRASASQAHYLGTVMRRQVGDPVRLFNGADGEWDATIAELRRDTLGLVVAQLVRPQSPEPDLWLAFAPLKRDATDLLVQKATELGASALLPIITARTNTARVNTDRLAAIAMEAAEQSERLSVPRIASLRPLGTLLNDWPAVVFPGIATASHSAERALTVAIERRFAPPVRPVTGPAALLVGPEGGFAPSEIDALTACAFVVPATLGPRILRAETAAMAGLVLLLAGTNS